MVGISFINPRASLTRAAFKRDFLVNLKAISFFGSKLRKSNLREFLSNLSLILAIDLLPPSLGPKMRNLQRNLQRNPHESIFGPLNFFNLTYIKGGVRGNINIGIKKCTTIFIWE